MFFWIFFGMEFEKPLPYLKQNPQIRQYKKFHTKGKNFNFGSKNNLFGFFGLPFEKEMAIFDINNLTFLKMQSLVQREKNNKFGTKNVLCGYFWMEFENDIVMLEISSFDFVKNKF